MLVGAPLVATPKADPRSEPAWLDAAAIAVIDRLLSTRPSQNIRLLKVRSSSTIMGSERVSFPSLLGRTCSGLLAARSIDRSTGSEGSFV